MVVAFSAFDIEQSRCSAALLEGVVFELHVHTIAWVRLGVGSLCSALVLFFIDLDIDRR